MLMTLACFFDGRKVVFDRIEVRRIGQEKQEGGSGLFNELLGFGGLMKRGIVHDHHMILLQDRAETLFQPLIENLDSTRSLPQLGGLESAIDWGCQEAGARARISGAQPIDLLPPCCPAILSNHFRFKAALIHIDKGFLPSSRAFSQP